MISSAWRRASSASSRSRSTSASASSSRVDSAGSTAARSAPPPIAAGEPVGGGLLVATARLGERQRASGDPSRVPEAEPLGLELGVLAGADPDRRRGPRRGRALAAARRRRCWRPAGRRRRPRRRRATPGPHRRWPLARRRTPAPPKASSTSRCQLRRSMRWLVPWAVTSTHRSPSSRSTACETSAPSIRQVARPDAGTSRDSVIRSSSGIPSSARRARRRGLGLSKTAATRAAAAPVRTASGSSRPPSAARSALTHIDLPGAGLAGQDAEAVVEGEPRFLDDREVADPQLTKGHWSLLVVRRGRRRRPARGAGPCAGCRSGTSGAVAS